MNGSRSRSNRLALLAAIVAGVMAAPLPLAEVSVETDQNLLRGFLMISSSGGDDPSPWPTWALVRQTVDANEALNSSGDTNGDESPGFSLHPQTRYPHLAWSWWDGTDYEIVVSRWTGSQWSAWEQITDNGVDDLDPAITLGTDGTTQVTWWRRITTAPSAPEENVWFVEALNGTADAWTDEELVTSGTASGRRPSVAVRNGTTWIAYGEQLSNLATPDRHRVFVTRHDGAGWPPVRLGPVVATSGSGDARPDLRVQVHVRKGVLWIDWVEGDGLLAYRVYDPQTDSWSVADTLSFADDLLTAGNDAIAEAMGRQRIERLVASGN